MSLRLEDNSEIQLWINRRPDVADNERWDLYEQGVAELAAQVQEAGSKLISVYFTTASVIYAPYDVKPAATVLADVENNHLISEKLANISSEYDILYLDTTPVLQEMAATAPLLYAWDGHFTQEGHEIVASIIGDFLNEQHEFDME